MRISYEDQVHGLTVVDASGRAIGEVDAMYLDDGALPGYLAVDVLRIRLRNDVADQLGIAHGAFHPARIEVPARVIQAIGDAVVLQVPVASLMAPPPSEPPAPSAA